MLLNKLILYPLCSKYIFTSPIISFTESRNNLSTFYNDASSLLDIDDSGQVSLKDLDNYNLLKRIENPGKVYTEKNADLKTT